MPQSFHRDRFTWLAYLLLAFYGYFLNVLGPITPFLKSELGLSYTVSSLHFTAFGIGMLLVGLGGHLVIERLGRWRSLWLGAGGLSLSTLVLLAGRTPVVTIGAAFCMGLVGSLTLAIIPSALSDRHGELRAVPLSESNVISSMAAAIGPLMVGGFAQFAGGWRLALGIAALTPIVLYLVFRKVTPPPEPVARQDLTRAGGPLPALFWIYWVSIVLAVSVEFCMIFWSADYMENVLGIPKVNAAQAVSVFIAAMIIGRLAGSRLVQKFSTLRVISLSLLVAGIGFLVFWKGGNVPLGLGGLFFTGLGVASLYPLLLALAIGAAGDNTVQASARATLASGLAILSLPFVLGRLADAMSIGPAYGVVVFLLLGVFVTLQIAGRLATAKNAKEKIINTKDTKDTKDIK